MPRKVVIVCGRPSSGASLLRDEIRALGVPATKVPSRITDKDVLINWGCSMNQSFTAGFTNSPANVMRASDKSLSFVNLRAGGVPTPLFTGLKAEVSRWICRRVLCRSLLRASCGRGIQILERVSDLPDCSLYVEYMPKDAEFRIHVMAGQVIARQKKVRKIGTTPAMEIRSHDNGWIFARNFTDPPEMQSGYLNDLAVRAVAALGLDFGAVDIIWSRRRNAAFVLEVNTAPGLEGQTAKDYAAAIVRSYYRRDSD